MKKLIAAAIVLALAVPALADQSACDKAAKKAEKDEAQFFPREGYKVAGKGRLYFHSAPDETCKSPDVFVIAGDEVIAYSEYKGWYSIMYINPRTKQDFQGWVDGKRLKFIGTEGPNN